jgi:hypothetical protein
MPKGALAVDGSLRTFTCEVVVPSWGAVVGTWVGGTNVPVGRGSGLGGKVDVIVIMKGVGVTELGAGNFKPQLETAKAAVRIRKTILCTR